MSERLALAMTDSDFAIVLLALGILHRRSRALIPHRHHLGNDGHRDFAWATPAQIEPHRGVNAFQLLARYAIALQTIEYFFYLVDAADES